MAAPLACACLALGAGCSIAPKNFRKLTDPAPIVRARSVSLGAGQPQSKVVPALIDRLEDKDDVVRLVAFEELRKVTGKTFGYVPWAAPEERAAAVARWRGWWKERQAALAKSGTIP
jgi:hypothetical protein